MTVREVLRLDRELDAVLGARPRDPAACAAVLERAAYMCRTDPAAGEHWVEAELLDELVDCYEALGRVDEAITVMRRALQVGWAGQPDGRCRIAELLMRDGRTAQAAEIWEQVWADTPGDVWLYNNAGLEYAAIGNHEEALRWLTQGLRVAMDTGDPEGLVGQLLGLREDSLTELGRPADELQERAAVFLTDPPAPPTRPWFPVAAAPPRPRPRPVRVPDPPIPWPEKVLVPPPGGPAPLFPGDPMTLALAWFPADEYPVALARWPELATEGAAKGAKDHAQYNRALQRTLQNYADTGQTRLFVAPIRIRPYLDWCARQGKDPAEGRAGYCAELARRRDPGLIAWPPGRNERCWCGSGRKYKQCCGSVRS